MNFALGPFHPARVAAWAIAGSAGVAGAWFSFDFGQQIGGLPIGVIAAANGAAMCSLLTGAALDRLWPRRAAAPGEPD
jgi:hypothetical protein